MADKKSKANTSASNTRTTLPKPSNHNPGFQNFDLSDNHSFNSDGKESLWPTHKIRISDKDFLDKLTQAYNARPDLIAQGGGDPVHFEGEPPQGYALFRKDDLYIHGHPSGAAFRSIKSFIDHVHAILTDTVATCGCVVCRSAKA